MKISALAGKPAQQNMLVDIPKLVTAFYTGIPAASVAVAVLLIRVVLLRRAVPVRARARL